MSLRFVVHEHHASTTISVSSGRESSNRGPSPKDRP